jgi:hypothetical protein
MPRRNARGGRARISVKLGEILAAIEEHQTIPHDKADALFEAIRRRAPSHIAKALFVDLIDLKIQAKEGTEKDAFLIGRSCIYLLDGKDIGDKLASLTLRFNRDAAVLADLEYIPGGT